MDLPLVPQNPDVFYLFLIPYHTLGVQAPKDQFFQKLRRTVQGKHFLPVYFHR